MGGSILPLKIMKKIFKLIAILRSIRLIRLARKIEGIEKLIITIKFSLLIISNLLLLIMLIFLIYTIIGCYFFKEDFKGNEYINFKNFFFGLMTLFKVCTADSWFLVLEEIKNTNGKFKISYLMML